MFFFFFLKKNVAAFWKRLGSRFSQKHRCSALFARRVLHCELYSLPASRFALWPLRCVHHCVLVLNRATPISLQSRRQHLHHNKRFDQLPSFSSISCSASFWFPIPSSTPSMIRPAHRAHFYLQIWSLQSRLPRCPKSNSIMQPWYINKLLTAPCFYTWRVPRINPAAATPARYVYKLLYIRQFTCLQTCFVWLIACLPSLIRLLSYCKNTRSRLIHVISRKTTLLSQTLSKRTARHAPRTLFTLLYHIIVSIRCPLSGACAQWPTFPQLFISGEFVGGCDITTELHKSGELANMLAAAKQVAP